MLSPGRPAPPKQLSMSLSTQGLTSFVLFICSPLRGLFRAPGLLSGPATGCHTPVWLEAGPRDPGVVGESSDLLRPPGSWCSSMSGCQMTVVGAAAGTSACARGMVSLLHALMCSAFPEENAPHLPKPSAVTVVGGEQALLIVWYQQSQESAHAEACSRETEVPQRLSYCL